MPSAGRTETRGLADTKGQDLSLHDPHYLIPLPPTTGLGARLAATSTLTLPQFSLSLRRFLKSTHYTLRTARFRTSARCCLCRGEIVRGDRYVDGGSYGRRACMGCWTALQEEGWVDRCTVKEQ